MQTKNGHLNIQLARDVLESFTCFWLILQIITLINCSNYILIDSIYYFTIFYFLNERNDNLENKSLLIQRIFVN